MTEYGLPFDGIVIGDASKAPYSAAEWARQWKLREGLGAAFPNYGVFAGSGNGTYQPLEVRATNPVSSNVEVQIGAGLIDGRFYETTAIVPLSINANVSGNSRIDTIVLRLDYVLQTVRLAVKQGTPAASPVRPTLQQDASFWEIPVGDIAVANGFTTLAQAVIMQRQRWIESAHAGWMPYAYPMAYIFGATPSGTISLTSGVAAIIPFDLTGNIILSQISGRFVVGAGVGYEFGWDLYIEDTNDRLTSENTLRRVAQSNGNASDPSPGPFTANLALTALQPTALHPGIYWLVLQNRHASNQLSIAGVVGGTFGGTYLRTKTFPLVGAGQTADLSTSTANINNNVPALRMHGQVFGESVTF